MGALWSAPLGAPDEAMSQRGESLPGLEAAVIKSTHGALACPALARAMPR